jgi:heptosyltransferase-3
MIFPERILVIKLRYIGDVILSLPVVIRLREAFPKAHVTMLVNAGTEQVAEGHRAVDDVLVVERSNLGRQWNLIRELRRRHFDLAIDLTDGDRSAILSWLSGAAQRIGYNSENRWRGKLYNHIVSVDGEGLHMIRYHLASTEAIGLSGRPPAPSMRIAPEAKVAAERLLRDVNIDLSGPVVCLHPGARWWFKAWPTDRFALLADRIQLHTNAQALFVGGSQDRLAGEKIAAAMSTPHRTVVGKTTLQELAAILERATLLVSNDNGPMHMAAAVGTAVIGLFGPSDPAVWGPWGEKHVTFYKHMDCRACFHPDCFRGEDNCMRRINVEEVWPAVQARLTN